MFVSAGFELKIHTSSDDGVVESHPVQQHSPSKIISISLCNDNSYIAVLRENEKPQILSAKDKNNVRTIHTINITNVTVLKFKRNTKKNIALGTNKGDVCMYDTKTKVLSIVVSKICNSVKSLDFTCDDQQLCGIDGDTIFVFPEIATNTTFLKYKQSSECTLLRCHPFVPNRAAVGCKNGHIALWDVQRGVELVNVEVFVDWPTSGLAMSSCGNYFVVSSTDIVKICAIDLNSATCNFEFYLEQDKEVSCVDLSCDDRFLAVGLVDGTLKLYDVKHQLKQVYNTKIHQNPINIISFENKAKELNSNFSSMIRMTDQEIKDYNEGGDISFNAQSMMRVKKSAQSIRDESLDKMKRHLFKVIKNEMDCLENQLHEHCVKFQKFLDNEFETIDGIIKKKWNVFNAGDMNQIIKAIFPEECKSNCT